MKSFLLTKKVLSTSLVGSIAAVCVIAGVAASATSSTPIQGSKPLALVISADTVTGGGTPAPASTCVQSNIFKHGQKIVFRVWGTDVKNGGYPLTPKNVASAFVKIPGEPNLVLTWNAESIAFWENNWIVPSSYPVGRINFTIVFKTKKTSSHPSYKGTFTQNGFSSKSQLQVTT
jgi:hypothetical protein